MTKLIKLLALPLLAISLSSCGGSNEQTSSEEGTQSDWLEEEKALMYSTLGGGNVIPFSDLFVRDGNEYTVVDYFSVGKVAVECLLPSLELDEQGEIYYDPLNDLDEYKDFCLTQDYELDISSNLEAHDYVLKRSLDTGNSHISSTIILEIYLTDAGYLTIDGSNETTYQVNFWPSMINLANASLSDLQSVAELLGKEENQIPVLTGVSSDISIVYGFQMVNGNLEVRMSIDSLDSALLDKYALNLIDSGYVLDVSNSSMQYSDYYHATYLVDVLLDNVVTNHRYQITFIAY